MNGDMLLPKKEAVEKQLATQQNMMLTQYRMKRAGDIHQMLLAKSIQLGQSEEPWKGTDPDAPDADLIGQMAAAHTDALMRALFPGFRVGKAEEQG